MNFAQILFLVGITIAAGYAGIWFRRAELSGLELWLPIGLIISYAINPLVGFAVAFSIMIITWTLQPYGLHHLAISAAFMGGAFYFAPILFPVAEKTFLLNSMLVAVIFQAVANGFYIVTGYPLIRIARFVAVNLLFCLIIFSKIGWQLLLWLK